MPITFETDYLWLLSNILENGEQRNDRTGTGTKALFGERLIIDLKQGFPLLETKMVPFKAVLSELLWFIEGSGDERRLAEILHGTRDEAKRTIWTPNAEATSGSKFTPRFKGDLGRVYGVQWRSWRKAIFHGHEDCLNTDTGSLHFGAKVEFQKIDQLATVVERLKTNPQDRRLIVSAWNPAELDDMALPPCHMFMQFYVNNQNELSCQMYQRSVDTFLGLPFNIASYALLTHMIAHVVGATVDKLIMVLGDTHIYNDHQSQVITQLNRGFADGTTWFHASQLPKLTIDPSVNRIDGFSMNSFTLTGYTPMPAIKATMSA